MNQGASSRIPLVPWRKIAGLALLSAPPVVLAIILGIAPAAAAVGFMTGFLAALVGGSRWTAVAIAVAVAASFVTGLLPDWGIYGVGLAFCVALSLIHI